MEDVNQANDSAVVSSTTQGSTNQTENDGATSNPADTDKSVTDTIPYSRFKQVNDKSKAKDDTIRLAQEENRLLHERIANMSKADSAAVANVEVSEGIAPFKEDIQNIVEASTAPLRAENERLNKNIQDSQLHQFEQNVLSQEQSIRSKYTDKPGFRSYDDCLDEMQNILTNSPNRYNDLDAVYREVNRDGYEQYVKGLEAKAGITRTEQARLNATPESSNTDSAVPSKPRNLHEKARQAASAAQNRLQSE